MINKLRQILHRLKYGWSLGIGEPVYMSGDIRCGKNVTINPFCSIDAGEETIFIGKNTHISPNSVITTSILNNGNPRVHLLKGNITIKENAWIGANSVVLAGITIGENSVVGAGSVVTKDVPDNCVYVGVPAKFLKELK